MNARKTVTKVTSVDFAFQQKRFLVELNEKWLLARTH